MDKPPLELGTGTTCHLLLITPTGTHLSEFWNSTLAESGFNITYAGFADWQDAISQQAPQIMLLDATENVSAAFDLCRESAAKYSGIPLVAVMTRSDLSARGASWHANGAKNFLRLDATRAEVVAVLESEIKTAALEKTLAEFKQRLINSRQYDNVTQFLTRRHFFYDAHRECGRARRYGRPLSCIMININYYEDYDKMFGAPCTNYLLRQLSHLLRQWTRESDIIARFAPHKIVALLPETDIHGAVMVRERLLESIYQYDFTWDEKPLPISVSVGEAERSRVYDAALPDSEEDTVISVREEIAQLLEDADNAMAVAQKSVQRPEMFITYAEMPSL